jgi:integrase
MGKSHQKGWVILRGKKWYGYFRREVIDPETNQPKITVVPIVLGARSKLSKFGAKEALEREIARVTGFVSHDRSVSNASVTFGWFVRNRFFPLKEADWREETAKVKKYLIETDLIEKFDRDRLEDIDKFALQTHLNKLAKMQSRDRVLQIRAYMQAIFSEAVDQDYLPKDPARKVKVPAHLRETDKTVLTWDQLRLALAELTLQDRILLELDMTNALRPSELFAFRWKCFECEACSLEIMETVYKGKIRPWGKTRKSLAVIHIPRSVADDLEQWRKQCRDPSPDAFIFTNGAGGFLDTDNYRKRVLHKLAHKLKLPKLTFQVIRRTVATLAQKKGTVKDVQGVLRHSRTATTTDIYMQEIPEGVRGTIDSIHRELTKSMSTPKSGGGTATVSGRRTLQERRSGGKFPTPSQKGFENLLPNATKPEEAEPLSC